MFSFQFSFSKALSKTKRSEISSSMKPSHCTTQGFEHWYLIGLHRIITGDVWLAEIGQILNTIYTYVLEVLPFSTENFIELSIMEIKCCRLRACSQ